MAKHRRAPNMAKGKDTEPEAPRPPGQTVSRPIVAKPAASSVRRSADVDAVALYERGLDQLQRHEYQEAAATFESVLQQYPEEKELHERVRLYLIVCQRQTARRSAPPQTIEERLFASTIAVNGGRYDEAIAQLHLVRDEDPDNDHALYMLAVAHAQRGEHAEAVAHLERAIAVNPENRGLARTDPDLEPLRGDDSFRAALEGPASSRLDRRRPFRTRAGR